MKKWAKEEALKTLKELADEAERLKRHRAFSAEHTKWIMKCYEILEEVFGKYSRYYLSYANLEWRKTGSYIVDSWKFGGDYEAAHDAVHHQAYIRDLEAAKGLLLAAVEYLEDRGINEVFTKKELGKDASRVLTVLNLAEQKLRKVIRGKPKREKEVQDAFENLLIGADIPYGREADSIEYSTKTYKPDFTFPEIDLAVELKLCGQVQREKVLPKEINDDILAYKTKYQNLIFIVYDIGIISNQEKFCSSFEKHDDVIVRVVKH